MKIGIIGAMAEEVALIKTKLIEPVTTSIAGIDYYEGTIDQYQIVLVQSGIGKVNAAINTTILIEHFHVDYVINTGTAGSLDNQHQIGDLVIASELIYHDVDVTGFGYEPGQMAGMPRTYDSDDQLVKTAQMTATQLNIQTRLGQIVSGDQFIHSTEQTTKIKRLFPQAIACEMESAAIAQACYVLKTPFVIIRAISDGADASATISFDEFVHLASQQSAEFVLSLVSNLN